MGVAGTDANQKPNAQEISKVIDRHDWTPDALHDVFVKYGCAVVRQAVPENLLFEIKNGIDLAYSRKDDLHVYDKDIAKATDGRLTGFEAAETPLLQEFLGLVFRGQNYKRAHVTARRIQGTELQQEWQKPLDLHLDCQFHSFNFTVNFWMPFENCGVDAPSVQFIPIDYQSTRRYSGFNGALQRHGQNWQFGYFPAGVFEFDRVVANFGNDAFFRPVMAPGDVIVASNWIIHGSYRTPTMKFGRTSMEVRFIGDEIDLVSRDIFLRTTTTQRFFRRAMQLLTRRFRYS
jgi:hypothetical protein